MRAAIKRENYQGPVGASPFVYAGDVCNNRCVYCFERDLIFRQKSTDELRREIAAIREKFDLINFMGQEPTLRKDIFELIRYAKGLKFSQIGITTNGRLLAYPDFAHKLADSGLDQAVITVAGCNALLHDRHTAAKGSFKETLQGIKNFIALQKERRLSLVLNVMVTKLNYKELLKIVKFYIDLGVKEINIGHILPFNKNIVNSRCIIAKMSQAAPYLIKIQEKFGALAKFLFVEYPPCIFPKKYRHLSFPCLEESPQKVRFDLCAKCAYVSKCAGVHQYYINLYGAKEFKL
ncbi:MAG: radical SAM protein [Candidatus Portnoybacteria bacterium]|nr:radical SAM protein [Candidatus Portnoybacteria bacterium]MDD4982867.1 radical SAM protein [Candidatus Portnoybacteria bacterium]